MDDHNYIFAVTLVAGAVTWALRALPFAILAPLCDSKILPYLAERMPIGVMAILTVYTLRPIHVIEMSSVIPAAVGVIVSPKCGGERTTVGSSFDGEYTCAACHAGDNRAETDRPTSADEERLARLDVHGT